MSVASAKERIKGQPPEAGGFPALLKTSLAKIANNLPRHLNPNRMARLALESWRLNPSLAKCDPRSVLAAVLKSSQLGLEIGMMGEAHLVPFKSECTLIPGYQGLIKLARNSGYVTYLEARVVHKLDDFRLEFGDAQVFVHRPFLDGDPGAARLAYALAKFKDEPRALIEPMRKDEIEAIRDGSPGYRYARDNKLKHPWLDPHQVGEMWRKTTVRRIAKYLPKSVELAEALALDNQADAGEQALNLDEILEGEWERQADDGGGGSGAQQARTESRPAASASQDSEGPSPEEIAKKIAAAASLDDLATCFDWLNSVKDATVRRELAEQAQAKSAQLKQA
jgi:recombination protein RecT